MKMIIYQNLYLLKVEILNFSKKVKKIKGDASFRKFLEKKMLKKILQLLFIAKKKKEKKFTCI